MRLRNRGKNVWQLRWELPRKADGTRHQRTETFHGNKHGAEARWRAVQADLDQNDHAAWSADSLTLRDYLAKWWEHKAPLLAPSTQSGHQSHMRRYLVPQLGDIPLRKLTALHIDEAMRTWSTQPRQDGKPGTISARTVMYCRSLLGTALQQAVIWDLIPANPIVKVSTPKKDHHELLWWTQEEAAQFLQVSDTHRLAVVFRLALYGGLRLGEVLALRWQDVDFEASTITIAQTASRHGKSRAVIGEPKTRRSRRTIPCEDTLMQALALRQQAQQIEQQLPGAVPTELVCTTAQGRLLVPRYVGRLLTRLTNKAHIKVIRFHDLRHTHATWLAQAGVNPRVIADRLGHSQVSFTLQTYVHANLDDQREALKRLAPVWPPSSPFGPHNSGAE